MSALPAVLFAASTVMQTVSAIQQGKLASAQTQAQGSAMQANANLAIMEAEAVKKSGAYEEAKLIREKQKAISTQRALYAKSGVLFSEGSPLEVMADTATQYEMDIQATRYNIEVAIRQKEYEADYLRRMGSYYSGPLAKSYKKAGYVKAGSTLLTGALQTYSALPVGNVVISDITGPMGSGQTVRFRGI